MIKRLSVSNYRSLGENVTVELGPFTALVGPNGSGKSNVVDVFRFVSDAMNIGLSGALRDRDEIGALRRWSGGPSYDVAIEVELLLAGDRPASYRFELRADEAEEYEGFEVHVEEASIGKGDQLVRFRIESGQWVDGPPGLNPPLGGRSLAMSIVGGDARFQPLVHALQRIAVYTILPDALRGAQRYSPLRPMDRYGSNCASILKDQPEETWKPEIISALHKLTGDIVDIKLTPVDSHLIVRFRHTAPGDQAKWLWTTQESDGTLRVAGILTALLQDPPVPVIAI